jgi:hypothetical protein
MNVRMILSLSCALLAACGGSDPNAQPTNPGTTNPAGASTATGTGGKGGLDIGTNDAVGGALNFNDQPVLGETSVSGLVLVIKGGTQGTPPPADTAVTLNGVTLRHAVLPAGTSDKLFEVDPAGPQPTLGADGFLHLAASSASLGVTRQLNLFCPAAFPVTLTPAAGSSLAVGASVKLSWAGGSLPVQGRDFSAFGLTEPSVSLMGYDATTHAMTFIGNNPQPLAAGAVGATTVPVGPTTTSGYMVELRYPGVFFVDGETAGACARTRRFAYAK